MDISSQISKKKKMQLLINYESIMMNWANIDLHLYLINELRTTQSFIQIFMTICFYSRLTVNRTHMTLFTKIRLLELLRFKGLRFGLAVVLSMLYELN